MTASFSKTVLKDSGIEIATVLLFAASLAQIGSVAGAAVVGGVFGVAIWGTLVSAISGFAHGDWISLGTLQVEAGRRRIGRSR